MMMKKWLCLTGVLAMLLCCAVGCSEAPAKTDDTQTDTATTTTKAPDLTPGEQELFDALDNASKLALGMKDTPAQATVYAAALLDWCEQSALSEAELQAAAQKYYDTYGSEFKIMVAEKIRLVTEACEALRDETTRASVLAEAGASSDVAWTDKAFDAAAVIGATITE